MDRTDISALIGSRICHDLISPLGAIGNGVELLSLSGMGASPEMALIAESIENANARIRFFRVAFGAAPLGIEVGPAESDAIVRDMFKTTRTTVNWRIEGPQQRADIKLAFLLIQCLENTLPRGGTIDVTQSGGQWKMDARGDRIRETPELWELLKEPDASATVAPADVHFALVAQAAKNANRQIATFIGDEVATVSF